MAGSAGRGNFVQSSFGANDLGFAGGRGSLGAALGRVKADFVAGSAVAGSCTELGADEGADGGCCAPPFEWNAKVKRIKNTSEAARSSFTDCFPTKRAARLQISDWHLRTCFCPSQSQI